MNKSKPEIRIALTVSVAGAVTEYFVLPRRAHAIAKEYEQPDEYIKLLKEMAKAAGYRIEKIPTQRKLL